MSAYLKSSLRKHWKLLGLALVIVIVLSSSAYAYWRVNAPIPALYVTATYPPLELRLELEKTEFQQGEKVVILLFLKNIGSEPVEIRFNQWWDAGDDHRHVIRFIVQDENDTSVYIYPILMFLSVYDVVLEPGEQRIETYEWTQTYNQDPYYGQSFKLGAYKVIGETMTFGIVGRNLPKGHRLETPPIAITIT